MGGMGRGQSGLTSDLDIELIRSTLDIGPTAAIADVCIRDVAFFRTLASLNYTTYHIRLRNPSRCTLSGLMTSQGGTAAGSNTRTGGIWLEAGAGTTYPGSVNTVYDCLLDNGSLWVQARDNHFSNLWVWGQNLNKTVYVEGSGNYFSQVEVIPNPYTNGYHFTPSAQGCTVDAPVVDGSTATIVTGTGIYADRAYGLNINGGQIYNCTKHGIHFVDMLEGVINGTRFKNCNRINDPSAAGYDPAIAYDDILMESKTFASSGNAVSSTQHSTSSTRTTKGHAIRELNGGSIPGPQSFTDITVPFGQYAVPNVLRLNSGTSRRNNRGSSNVQSKASGSVTIASGASTISVSHGVVDALIQDSEIYARPISSLAAAGITSWVAAKTSASQFAITLNTTATAAVTFTWSVDLL